MTDCMIYLQLIHPARHKYLVLVKLNTTLFSTQNVALMDELTNVQNGRKQTFSFQEDVK